RDRKDNKRWLSVTIEDNGKGMTAAIKSKLFRAFVTNKKEGTGLGLAQAKRIVDLHSGEIYVESSSDKGTIVVINLPVDDNINNKDSGNSN
ncbi:MAG: ATP-binding protein, partial [Candidatus Zixiibacteriota bacterium]